MLPISLFLAFFEVIIILWDTNRNAVDGGMSCLALAPIISNSPNLAGYSTRGNIQPLSRSQCK